MGTAFRAVLLVMAVTASALAAGLRKQGFVPLFNGTDLTGWEGDADLWSVEDGAITGRTVEGKDLPFNKFLIWRGGTVKNFELRLKIRQTGNNSGIQYRARERTEVGPFSVSGYQCDVHPNPPFNAQLYEERGRGIVAKRGEKIVIDEKGDKWLVGSTGPVVKISNDEWHEFTVIAKGNHLVHKIDGQLAVEVTDHQEAKRSLEGILAIQLHRGPPMTVQVKDIWLKALPETALVPVTPIPPTATKVLPPKRKRKPKPKKHPPRKPEPKKRP